MIDDLEKFIVKMSEGRWFTAYFAGVAILVSVAGVGWGNRFAMPVLVGVAFWPFFIYGVREEGDWPTLGRICFGFAVLAIAVTVVSSWWSLNAGMSIWGGADLYNDTQTWISGSGGRLGKLSLFSRGLLLDYLIMGAATVLTGGLGGVILAAAAINAVAYNSAILYSESASPVLALMLAWTPWDVVKSVSFVFLLFGLSGPVRSKIPHFESDEGVNWNFVIYGCSGLFAALLLYVLLNGIWQRALLSAING